MATESNYKAAKTIFRSAMTDMAERFESGEWTLSELKNAIDHQFGVFYGHFAENVDAEEE